MCFRFLQWIFIWHLSTNKVGTPKCATDLKPPSLLCVHLRVDMDSLSSRTDTSFMPAFPSQSSLYYIYTSPKSVLYLCGRNAFRTKLCSLITFVYRLKCSVLWCVEPSHLPTRTYVNLINLIIVNSLIIFGCTYPIGLLQNWAQYDSSFIKINFLRSTPTNSYF